MAKWGVSLLEMLPKIIQYVSTFIGITKSSAIWGGLKNIGFGLSNSLFGTKFGYGDASTGKSKGLLGGILNKNGVNKEFIGKETGKIHGVLENILRFLQGRAMKGKIGGETDGAYSTYLKLTSSSDKQS